LYAQVAILQTHKQANFAETAESRFNLKRKSAPSADSNPIPE
jgi:hypothetical protein